MPRRPNGVLLALAMIAALAGLIFALQGLGAPIGRSFMIGDLRWTAIGAALVIVAAAIGVRELRRR
ncbi:MAG TPA: hypothetical protein VET90_00340 [Candidatus Binatus sp.]|nr:hypothetical protein [Candidatus Binatus sp.]